MTAAGESDARPLRSSNRPAIRRGGGGGEPERCQRKPVLPPGVRIPALCDSVECVVTVRRPESSGISPLRLSASAAGTRPLPTCWFNGLAAPTALVRQRRYVTEPGVAVGSTADAGYPRIPWPERVLPQWGCVDRATRLFAAVVVVTQPGLAMSMASNQNPN